MIESRTGRSVAYPGNGPPCFSAPLDFYKCFQFHLMLYSLPYGALLATGHGVMCPSLGWDKV